MLPYHWFRKIAFMMDPEMIHHIMLKSFSTLPGLFGYLFEQKKEKRYVVPVGDLSWPFPVGLAAGLDKDATAVDFFSRLLFGGIEVGTVTPRPCAGNPRPRLFRLKEDSLLNRMGFNNKGADIVLDNIKKSNRQGTILGVNLGKNRETSLENALDDYKFLYKKFAHEADYLTANVSSPNTPGLRDLQKEKALEMLLLGLRDLRHQTPTPLFLKISPDLPLETLPSLVEIAEQEKLAGLIATNTTVMPKKGKGGVSGKLLYDKAEKTRNLLLNLIKGTSLELIGVGGFSNFSQIWEFWKKGGKVVQVYTAFIYQGPEFLLHIKKEIDRVLSLNNMNTLTELLSHIDKARYK